MEHPPPWTPAPGPVPDPVDEATPVPADPDPVDEAPDDATGSEADLVVAPPPSSDPRGEADPPAAPDPAAPDGRATLDLDSVTADLAAVEAALERLDQGGYGRCGACASTIDDDVLAADPTATTCAAHLPV